MSNSFRVFCGIDPGTTKTALVVWDGKTVLDKNILPNGEVLGYISRVECDVVACEHMQSFGMAVGKEVFETCYWLGRYWQICNQRPLLWYRVFRSQVKLHHCHSTKANDSNIRTAIIDQLGPPGTQKQPGPTFGVTKDLWSALAISMMAYDHHLSFRTIPEKTMRVTIQGTEDGFVIYDQLPFDRSTPCGFGREVKELGFFASAEEAEEAVKRRYAPVTPYGHQQYLYTDK